MKRYRQDTWIPWFELGRMAYNTINAFFITFAVMAGVWVSLRCAGIMVQTTTLDARTLSTQSEAEMIQAYHDSRYELEDE